MLLASLIGAIQMLAPWLAPPPSLPPCAPPFELRLPFREASVWEDYRGDPDSTVVLTQGFHVILGRFIPGPADTWFVYGLPASPARGAAPSGLDFVARPGLRVRATAGGRVSFVGDLPGLGRTVVVDHAGGFSTTYAELGSSSVDLGQRVYVGDELGRVAGGRVVAHVVHLELRQAGALINPLRYLSLAGVLVPHAAN
ncbi:MAG: M23 family metallopeptidase [Candidatus Andersenbacteria bacterium]